jgi:hypothetical protein
MSLTGFNLEYMRYPSLVLKARVMFTSKVATKVERVIKFVVKASIE